MKRQLGHHPTNADEAAHQCEYCYTSRMGFWGKLASAMHMMNKNEATKCMYGSSSRSIEKCQIIVPPDAGWRDIGLVYCSEEHAFLDQEDTV